MTELPLTGGEGDLIDHTAYDNDVVPPGNQDYIDTLPVNIATASISFDLDQLVIDSKTFDIGYGMGSGAAGLMSFSPDLRHALSSSLMLSARWVNTLLDSGCSHHLIKDRALFSTYDVSGATSVTTANCGSLTALASGDVTLRLPFKDRFVDVVLWDWIHAPDVLLHLLSVGVLQHAQIAIRFEPSSGQEPPYTELVFPHDHPVLPN